MKKVEKINDIYYSLEERLSNCGDLKASFILTRKCWKRIDKQVSIYCNA